ncbi:MAG: hypothetical protein LBL62_02300 [Planctomycetaceae bacterium]|jgi:hypothetical protein|nr:hypothetical protein [Planctomycetaceae bacterium]
MSTGFIERDIQGRQGVVLTGSGPLSGIQVQFHAPVSPNVLFNDPSIAGFTGVPNGRIVHLNTDGFAEPGLPNDIAFTMPLLIQSDGGKTNAMSEPVTYGHQTPYLSVFPGPFAQLNLVPMCTGYEFLSTEYVLESDGSHYVPGRTGLTAIHSLTDPVLGGLIKPITEVDEICLGFVSSPPGTPRPEFDFVAITYGIPNNTRSVTGKNEPGLAFWGCPFPAGLIPAIP